jgi:hypothetical protein
LPQSPLASDIVNARQAHAPMSHAKGTERMISRAQADHKYLLV